MKFKGTKGKWVVKKSNSKDAYNIVGTMLGGKYKVAISPYILFDKDEALSNAKLIAMAPEMLEAMISFVNRSEDGEIKSFDTYIKFLEIIKKATE